MSASINFLVVGSLRDVYDGCCWSSCLLAVELEEALQSLEELASITYKAGQGLGIFYAVSRCMRMYIGPTRPLLQSSNPTKYKQVHLFGLYGCMQFGPVNFIASSITRVSQHRCYLHSNSWWNMRARRKRYWSSQTMIEGTCERKNA